MDSAAAGYDIRCLNDFSISWDERVVVRTGLVIQPPEGYHTEIFLRSGMAFKYGIFLSNNIGLIDRNYSSATDELMVMLSRPKAHKVAEDGVFVGDYKVAEFKAGDRIAQLVIRKTEIFPVEEVFEAPSLIVRGGLGSTGQR
jgi:dUTP pyrophosphatase